MVEFYTQGGKVVDDYDSDVFPKPAVSAAISEFVPVKVDAEDGEGRPLVEQYQAHIQGYPAILFLNPAIEDPKDGRIVGKIPGFMPPASFVEQLNTIARLPKDIGKLQQHHAAHPDDLDERRQLVTRQLRRCRGEARRRRSWQVKPWTPAATRTSIAGPRFTTRWATTSCCVKGRMRPPDGSNRRPLSRNDRSISITPGWASASSRC